MSKHSTRALSLLLVVLCGAVLAATPAAAQGTANEADLDVLAEALTRPLKLLRGEMPKFTVTIDFTYKSEGDEVAGRLVLVRADAEQFGLALAAKGITAELVRLGDSTRLVVPPKGVALVGKGGTLPDSPLHFDRIVAGIRALDPKAGAYLGILQAADAGALALIIQQFGMLERVPAKEGEKAPATFVVRRLKEDRLTIAATADGLSIGRIEWKGPQRSVSVTLKIAADATLPKAATTGLTVVDVDRPELEFALGRGLVRAVDVLQYNSGREKPGDEVRKADAGRLVVDQGQRVAVLAGTPYQIGFQHGKMLAAEARRLTDAVLYCVGTAYSVEKKRWFLDDIRGVFKRLRPHIPAEYLDEMRGVADGSRIPLESVQLANVFPALFHCSGFVLLPKATQTDKLYHGRVLDYMTEIGLQRDAVLFAVRKSKAVPFANVGYAGFIGSVTGMNTSQVCIGEMGGGGAGQYDGTPMPILVRMALERARTLDEAVGVFREAKRTCEYYYCLSDAKSASAAGLYATPEKLDVIQPGQTHPLLLTPVADCLLMSAGSRYKELVARVKAKHGQFNAVEARQLMTRPVTMKSNLHNVLFVPSQLQIYVAHARGSSPAYKQKYVRHSLKDIFDPIRKTRPFLKPHGSGRDVW